MEKIEFNDWMKQISQNREWLNLLNDCCQEKMIEPYLIAEDFPKKYFEKFKQGCLCFSENNATIAKDYDNRDNLFYYADCCAISGDENFEETLKFCPYFKGFLQQKYKKFKEEELNGIY